MKTEVYKIQVPLATNMPIKLALIYNRDRSKQFQLPVDEAIATVMGDRAKAFFNCSIVKDKLAIHSEASWQGW